MNFRKKSLRWFSCLSLVMFLTVSWVTQAISQTAGGGGGASGGAGGSFSWMILVYGFMLTLFILIPTLTDICKSYKAQNANWTLIIEKLIDKAGKDSLDKDELKALIEATSAGPPGISGMSRSLMAFAIIIILGIAVFHLLSTQGPESEIVKNVMSMLGATLASITGFYFGGRSAEAKKEAPSGATPGGAAGGGAGGAAGGGAGGAGGAAGGAAGGGAGGAAGGAAGGGAGGAAGGGAGGGVPEGEANPETETVP